MTHVYAEDMNLNNYTYILFGKGFDHKQCTNVHFIYVCPISFYHNAPILDLHGSEAPFLSTSVDLRPILKTIYEYKMLYYPLELFIKEKFKKTNTHYNSINNVTLIWYKNRNFINKVYS